MDLFGNPDICMALLLTCDVSTAREVCLVLLSSRQYRNYGAQKVLWERLTKHHFGALRCYEALRPFQELPQALHNPHWPMDNELSDACRDFLETSLEYELFEAISIVPGDIGRLTHIGSTPVDCLMFPTNSSLVNFGIGAAGAIFNRAGPELLELVRSEPYRRIRRRTTEAVLTPGFNAGVDHLIHCIGPSPHRPDCEERLYLTYLNAFECARQVNARCIAIASISTGSLAFPIEEAARVAMRALRDFIKCHRWDCKIGVVCYVAPVQFAMTRERDAILRKFNEGCLPVLPSAPLHGLEAAIDQLVIE